MIRYGYLFYGKAIVVCLIIESENELEPNLNKLLYKICLLWSTKIESYE